MRDGYQAWGGSFWREVWQAAQHELVSLRHRKPLLLVSVVMPLLWLALLAASMGGSGLLHNLPVSWVSAPLETLPREVVNTLNHLPSIRWEHRSSLEADLALKNLKTYATLHIPDDFTRRYYRGEHPTIELTLNKAIYGPSSTIEYDISKAVSVLNIDNLTKSATLMQGGTLSAQRERLRLTQPELVNLGNTAFNFNPYLLFTLMPGLVGIAAALTFVSVISRALRVRAQAWPVSFLRPERKKGPQASLPTTLDTALMNQTYRAPLSRQMGFSAWVMGTVLPWVGWMLLVMTGVIVYLAGFDDWALPQTHLFFWLVSGWLLIGATLGIVLLFCGLAPNWLIATFMTTAFFAPAFPFTGFSFPLESMTPGAQFYGHLIPLTHFLRCQALAWTMDPTLSTWWRVALPLVGIMVIAGITGWARLSLRWSWPSLKEKEGYAKSRAKRVIAGE